MAIDTSIYQNIQPVQPNLQSPLDVAYKAQSLASLGLQQNQMRLQQQQMQYQMGLQQALRQAYANNTDQNGNVNRSGVMADLGKMGLGAQAGELNQQWAAQDKAQAEAKSAQMAAHASMVQQVFPAMEHLAGMDEDSRAKSYNNIMKSLESEGVDSSGALKDQNGNFIYDPQRFQNAWSYWKNSKAALDQQTQQSQIANTQAGTQNTNAKTAQTQAETAQMPIKAAEIQSNINKNNAELPKTAAAELQKFNEDINNASSRKTTGSLIDSRNRADRILFLLNQGAQPGETQEQRVARLNKLMPQIGTEVGASMASIMNGGVPPEQLTKEVSPDTWNSKIAELQQRVTANPTAANQGKLLDAYGEIAQNLRNFSQGRLQDITDRARVAYPYANKLFPKEMDKIASPILSPNSPYLGGSQDSTPVDASKTSQNKPSISAQDQAALEWLKSADAASPDAFAVRAKLKKKGLL